MALKKRNTDRKNENGKTFSDIPVDPLLLQSFHWNVPKSCQVFYLPVLSNCIFVNSKQPCSLSWWFRTMSMTSCNGSIVHLPRLLDLLHCCSLQMWAQRWIHLFQLRLLPWTMFHSLQCTMVNPFVAGSLVLFTFIEIMEIICEKAFKRAFKSNGC